MESFLPFFIVLFASIVFSTIFKKIHLPWVIALITAGVVVGPQSLDLLPQNETISFLGETGLIFLMFMAGLETKFDMIKKFQKEIIPLSIINGAIPFITGFIIGSLFGYNLTISILIGIIFVSSSIAIVIPSLEANEILKTRLGQAIMSTSILQDIASLLLLSIFLQTERPLAHLPLYLFYPILAVFLILMRYTLPKIERFFAGTGSDKFQKEIRAIFLVLFGTVIIFEILGLHSIIAGFFAGMVLADTATNESLKSKLRAISYGVFIPTFFVVVGAETDIKIFSSETSTSILVMAIVLGSFISKFISGFLGSLLVGFNRSQSLLFGASSTPQLSTTLAATFTATSLGLITSELATSLVILSIITTLIGPSLMGLFINSIISSKDLNKT